ncbi:MAG: hypothetical protein ACLUIQ_08825 [Dialister invisus]
MGIAKRKGNFLKYFLTIISCIVIFTGIGFGTLAYDTSTPKPPVFPPLPPVGAVSAVLMDGNTGDIIAQKEGN